MIDSLKVNWLSGSDFFRKFITPLVFSLLSSKAGVVCAANQDFPASGSLSASGDWATVTGPGVTVTIPGGFGLGSSDGTSTGFSVNANTNNDAIVAFLGNSNVVGTIGVTGGVVANILGGVAGSTVTFGGQCIFR